MRVVDYTLPMSKPYLASVVSAPREICEDAPCCGCCGHDRHESYDHEDYDYMNAPIWDEPEDERNEREGGEDSYLDASWEDRFEIDMGDY